MSAVLACEVIAKRPAKLEVSIPFSSGRGPGALGVVSAALKARYRLRNSFGATLCFDLEETRPQ